MMCVKKNLVSFVFSGFFWFKVVMSFSGDLLCLDSTAAAVCCARSDSVGVISGAADLIIVTCKTVTLETAYYTTVSIEYGTAQGMDFQALSM